MFAPLRDWTLKVCAGPYARYVLYTISFIESIFFPIPTDVALAPVVMRQPKDWMTIVAWCAFASVAGAILAYGLAYYFWSLLSSLFSPSTLAQVQSLASAFESNAFVWVLVSAFTPFPYKLCALAAGVAGLNLWLFIVASLIGRSLRFALVGGLVYYFRDIFIQLSEKYVEPLGWLIVVLFIVYIVWPYV